MARKQKQCPADKILDIVVWALLASFTLTVLYVLIYIISASFSDPKTVGSGEMWLFPVQATLEGYTRVFRYKDVLIGYGNSIVYTVLGTFFGLITILGYGYAISRKDLVGRRFFSIFILITMYFNGGIVSTYITMKNLGMLDTRWAICLIGSAGAYNILVSRTFFSTTIPGEITEAATIDGCSNLRLFAEIILPLSKPLIAIMIMYQAVSRWNLYFWPMVMLKTRSKFSLQIILKEILIQSEISVDMISSAGVGMVEIQRQAEIAQIIKYCVIVVSSVPLLALYPFFSRYFEKGIMIGAIKG